MGICCILIGYYLHFRVSFTSVCESHSKPKFKSVFQSDEKTRKKNRNSNSLFKVQQKRNSNLFLDATSRQKTKNRNGNGIPFYKAEERRKIKMKFECHFLCHRKTVGTKERALFFIFACLGRKKQLKTFVNFYFPLFKLKTKMKIALRLSFFIFQFSEKMNYPNVHAL